jgi:hypothetical protein
VGQTIADSLDALGLTLEQATYIEEPPGILRGLRLRTSSWNPPVTLWIARGAVAFSMERNWDEEKVLAAKIVAVQEM